MTQRNSRPADSWLRWVRDILGRRADAIAANSPGGVQWWQGKKAKGPVYLVNNIADPRRPAAKNRESGEILYVGRLEPQKNVLTMMKAFSIAVRDHQGLKMWVCGDGALRGEMEQLTKDEGIADKVQFLGFRPNAAEWMARTKVLVSLSDHEGMPNVVMEGVQAGASIVASSIPEHVALLGDTYPFLVNQHHNPDEVARVILRALAAPELTDDLSHARRQLASMEPATVAARYMDIFGAVMLSRSRRRVLGNK
jgi:glycosyltransferase involved in cell wall biosynthesis